MGASKRDPRAYPVEHDERAYRRLVDALQALAKRDPVVAAAIESGANPLHIATVVINALPRRC